jgi:hypothetical protein
LTIAKQSPYLREVTMSESSRPMEFSWRAVATFVPSGWRLLGAVLGGIVAGLVLSVWMLIGEVATGTPSQLISMERQVSGWFGTAAPPEVKTASMIEEYVGNFGLLLLSAIAGAACAFGWRRDRSVVLNGLMFGMAFFAPAHAVVGPILGLTPPIWRVPPQLFLLGYVINGFFGLCTAFFAHQFDRDSAHASCVMRHASRGRV